MKSGSTHAYFAIVALALASAVLLPGHAAVPEAEAGVWIAADLGADAAAPLEAQTVAHSR